MHYQIFCKLSIRNNTEHLQINAGMQYIGGGEGRNTKINLKVFCWMEGEGVNARIRKMH